MSAKKFQRRLKMDRLKKHFPHIKIEYFENRDVYEFYHKDRRIHACFAYEAFGDIVSDVWKKLLLLIEGK